MPQTRFALKIFMQGKIDRLMRMQVKKTAGKALFCFPAAESYFTLKLNTPSHEEAGGLSLYFLHLSM